MAVFFCLFVFLINTVLFSPVTHCGKMLSGNDSKASLETNMRASNQLHFFGARNCFSTFRVTQSHGCGIHAFPFHDCILLCAVCFFHSVLSYFFFIKQDLNDWIFPVFIFHKKGNNIFSCISLILLSPEKNKILFLRCIHCVFQFPQAGVL